MHKPEGDKTHLLNVLLEFGQASVDELLLGCIECAKRVDLADTVLVKGDLGSKVVDALVLEEGRLDEGGCGLGDDRYSSADR